jgi:hypothetical protein
MASATTTHVRSLHCAPCVMAVRLAVIDAERGLHHQRCDCDYRDYERQDRG